MTEAWRLPAAVDILSQGAWGHGITAVLVRCGVWWRQCHDVGKKHGVSGQHQTWKKWTTINAGVSVGRAQSYPTDNTGSLRRAPRNLRPSWRPLSLISLCARVSGECLPSWTWEHRPLRTPWAPLGYCERRWSRRRPGPAGRSRPPPPAAPRRRRRWARSRRCSKTCGRNDARRRENRGRRSHQWFSGAVQTCAVKNGRDSGGTCKAHQWTLLFLDFCAVISIRTYSHKPIPDQAPKTRAGGAQNAT